MSIDRSNSRLDYVLARARAGEVREWRRQEREVGVTPFFDGGFQRQVVDVVIPPSGPAYTSDVSRDSRHDPGADLWHFAFLAIDSFGHLVNESDEARKLLRNLRDQLDATSQAEVDQLLQQSTVRSRYDDPAPAPDVYTGEF